MSRPIRIKGSVRLRSSAPDAKPGPPGEKELAEANPDRQREIMAAVGWGEMVNGTLNLSVSETDVARLLYCTPVLTLKPPKYPEGFEKLAEKRAGYLYYRATVSNERKGKADCLVRRAMYPLKRRLELLSPVHLRETLGLSAGDPVTVDVPREPGRAKAPHVFRTADDRPTGLEDSFLGGHVFLCLSGPSIRDIDRGPLRFCATYCVNNSPKALMPKLRPTFWSCVDPPDKFLYSIWQDPRTTKLVPMGFGRKALWNSDTGKPVGMAVADCPNVYYFRRDERFDAKRYLKTSTVNWGNHSKAKDENDVRGKRSVMLAAIKAIYCLGFRSVYLLGCDFHMSEESKYAFDQDRKASSIRGNNSSYKQLAWRFEQLLPEFAAAGFEVFNCNPDSALTVFPHMPYLDAVGRALSFTGDWRRWIRGRTEKTAGLYESKWYRCPKCSKDVRLASSDMPKGCYRCECGKTISRRHRKRYEVK